MVRGDSVWLGSNHPKPHRPRSAAGRHCFDRDAAIWLEIVLQVQAGSTQNSRSRRCVLGRQNG